MAEDYKLDIVLLTHDRLDLTMQAMNNLYNHTVNPFHLIVVDNSTDLTPLYFAEAQKEFPNITFLHYDRDFKCGNEMFNIGFAKAVTPFVATVMNSCNVEPDWDIHGLQLMDLIPDVGIIGFKCLFPDGRIESAGISLVESEKVDGGKFAGVATHIPVDIGHGLPGHRASSNYECEAVQWAFALMRRKAVPKLDEDTFNGFKGWDDIDNCYAVKEGGWKIFYCGSGVCYHAPRATRGDNSEDAEALNRENAYAFFKRRGLWRGSEDTTDSPNP
jgi:GT2 family glycosyltransferase